MVTAGRLRSLLDYDPETGIFTWKPRAGAHRSWNTKYANKPAGSKNNYGYLTTAIDGKTYTLHRLAWLFVHDGMPTVDIDHINRVKSDNRIANLRPATDSENLANARIYSNNTSGFKGVSWCKRAKKWKAHIRKNGHLYYLGSFDNAEDASGAYLIEAEKLFGEFKRAA